MPRARSNGIELAYETIGDPGAEALLLVMGLGAQMILWELDFCRALAARGFRVIRFDNRDVGHSTKIDAAGRPNVMAAMERARRGEPIDAPYRLGDMADDAVGLLDALAIERAHVVGASMGGMIAQTMALAHPARVRTLTSIMSTTGHPSLPGATREAFRVLVTPAPVDDRDAFVAHTVAAARVTGSPGFPFDEAAVAARAAASFDRGLHPAGIARQLVAITASGSRREALRALRSPTLVIHGADDPLIRVEAGRDTAAAIPNAELLVIEGMGHDLPRGAWPQIVDAIARHARRR